MNKLVPEWHPLNWIDEYLQARGWTCDDTGWLPPMTLREMISAFCGRGHFRRAQAIRIQVDIDERIFAQPLHDSGSAKS